MNSQLITRVTGYHIEQSLEHCVAKRSFNLISIETQALSECKNFINRYVALLADPLPARLNFTQEQRQQEMFPTIRLCYTEQIGYRRRL